MSQNAQFITSSTAIIVLVIALLSALTSVRVHVRGRRRLSVPLVTADGAHLEITVRNEGGSAASDVVVRLRAGHDGLLEYRLDAIGPGAQALLQKVGGASDRCGVELSYARLPGQEFGASRSFRRTAGGPFGLEGAKDWTAHARFREAAGSFVSR